MQVLSCGFVHVMGQPTSSKMHRQKRVNDSVHWYMGELSSRIVASSGRAEDRFHLGKLLLHSLKTTPEFILQIDGALYKKETSTSVLERSIRCAIALRNIGLVPGDVMVLMAPNHLDLTIPFYAALYIGVAVSAVDRTLTVTELQSAFGLSKPKIIFCQSEKAPDVQLALNQLDLIAEIVIFDRGDYLLLNFSKFLKKHALNVNFVEFRPTDFDPQETTAMLIATSGTTGMPKLAVVTHKNFAISLPYVWSRSTQFPAPTRMCLIASPLQWLSAIIHFIGSAVLGYTRLQTSDAFTPEHAYYLINTFKPSYTIFSPTLMTKLLQTEGSDSCDFSCFDEISLAGSAVPPDLVEEVEKYTQRTEVFNVFGMSELTTLAFLSESPAPGSCGKPIGCFQYRIVDPSSEEDIMEPNSPGELWMKGPSIFKGYLNNPDATEETFAEDRWFKTGDMFYRDEHYNFYFMERIKLLLKYKSNHISPVELEGVIRKHPGVLDVAVTSIPDRECGDLPVACVIRKPGHEVTADDIKDLVKDNLSDSKQLRGGVIFMKELPITASTKIHRKKLKEMVLDLERE